MITKEMIDTARQEVLDWVKYNAENDSVDERINRQYFLVVFSDVMQFGFDWDEYDITDEEHDELEEKILEDGFFYEIVRTYMDNVDDVASWEWEDYGKQNIRVIFHTDCWIIDKEYDSVEYETATDKYEDGREEVPADYLTLKPSLIGEGDVVSWVGPVKYIKNLFADLNEDDAIAVINGNYAVEVGYDDGDEHLVRLFDIENPKILPVDYIDKCIDEYIQDYAEDVDFHDEDEREHFEEFFNWWYVKVYDCSKLPYTAKYYGVRLKYGNK